MCGIAGLFWSPALRESALARDAEPILRAMIGALQHRGPDATNVHLADGAAVAAARLRIVDPNHGHQPMVSEDNAQVLVFNGEIYNHRALRRELESLGAPFRSSHSDTEVLLQGYHHWSAAELCRRVDGMFAFAIWDARESRLILARDRTGEKPLYLARLEGGGALAIASELKALHAVPGWNREIHDEALAAYFALQYVPDPLTIFVGAEKFPPGQVATWSPSTGELKCESYWSPSFEPKTRIKPRAAREEVLALLDAAVQSRADADAPAGCFLSGGVDSAAVVALLHRANVRPVRTFTIGFDDPGVSELDEAAAIARHFHTEHHEHILTDRDALILPRVTAQFDEPFADPAALPTWYLCRMARESVTVALTGDGGDEAFGGYPRYLGFRPVPWWDRLPRVARRGAAGLLNAARPMEMRFPKLELARYVNRVSLLSPEKNYAEAMRYCTDAQLARMLLSPWRDAAKPGAIASRFLLPPMHSSDARENPDRFLASDFRGYLPGALLVKMDRMANAASLESRAPFLSTPLLEFTARLPIPVKFPHGNLKGLLKESLRGIVPQEVLHRRKRGFAIPAAAWLRGPLRPMVEEVLFDSQSRERGVLDPRELRRMWSLHRSGRLDLKRPLWAALCFELWARSLPPGTSFGGE